MYGYQIVFEHPSCRRKRSVLQIVSRQRHASVIALLRAEGLYRQYRTWKLVDFQIADAAEPEPVMKRVTDALPGPGSLVRLVA